MKTAKRFCAAALLLILLLALCGCKQNPSQQQLYAKLLDYFARQGYTCQLSSATEDLQVPIYQPQAWRTLTLNGTEQVLVYFDESNRADYLSEGIDTEEYGYVTRFGLRFVLVYPGQDEGVISALQAIPTDD